jgi:hypothetical protein
VLFCLTELCRNSPETCINFLTSSTSLFIHSFIHSIYKYFRVPNNVIHYVRNSSNIMSINKTESLLIKLCSRREEKVYTQIKSAYIIVTAKRKQKMKFCITWGGGEEAPYLKHFLVPIELIWHFGQNSIMYLW